MIAQSSSLGLRALVVAWLSILSLSLAACEGDGGSPAGNGSPDARSDAAAPPSDTLPVTDSATAEDGAAPSDSASPADLPAPPEDTATGDDVPTAPPDVLVVEDAAAPDAGPVGPAVGDPCGNDGDCGELGTCMTEDQGFPGGYCTRAACEASSCPGDASCWSFQSGGSYCLRNCAAPSDCRTQHGYTCDADDTCWPGGSGTVPPGGPCSDSEQCAGGSNAQCTRQDGFLGGYCNVVGCEADVDCPADGVCRGIYQSGESGCVGGCAGDDDCRPGYRCIQNEQSGWYQACFPFCAGDDDCPAPNGCRDELCVDVSHECSPANPAGDCPAGDVCDAGVCAPFECDDTLLEPNESKEAAVPLPAEDTAGFQVCAGDHDWFAFTPSAEGVLQLVGIDSSVGSGDLKADLVDEGGARHDDPTIAPDDYHEENVPGPTNLEVHAFVGAPAAAPWWLHVLGVSGATNNYRIVNRAVPWQDGGDCVGVYGQDACWATAASGASDPSKLLLFPLGHAADPYIGDGVFFDNGLYYASGSRGYTTNASLWGRRELLMTIRYAIHEVQETFPGTTPLGIGDVGMPDGTTPQGHPNGTHYLGANVDVAYYVRPEVQGQWGNMAYRVICCDKPITDWSCVDRTSSDINYGNCVPGSEDTHIVDIPRTALLLARLVGTGRIRGVGVDVRLEGALADGLDALQEQGLITATVNQATRARLWSIADDGSWLWHFNHMHVSFKTSASSKALGDEGRGLWPHLPEPGQADTARRYYRALPQQPLARP